MSPLRQLDYLPDGLLTAKPDKLHSILPEPTLIHLYGKKTSPLFISVMLHGNEPTGLLAVQALLQKYQQQELPRSITLFLGNTLAAAQGLRRLHKQPDFNRIWPGTEYPESAETLMTTEIVEIMRNRNVFASVDVHNNTGLNPHYACINNLEHPFQQLASLFGRLIVYFIRPVGVQSGAFAKICPAVTLECGRPGQQYGVEHAFEFLDGCLHLTELPDHPVPAHDIDLFHTVAQVTMAENISYSFGRTDVNLQLNKDLEKLNFTEIPAGTSLGKVNYIRTLPVIAKDELGNIVTDTFFSIENGQLFTKRPTMPSMLTLDERVIHQDCLCYLMERIPS